MNKNFVIGGLILLILIGGVVYFIARDPSTPDDVTITPPITGNNNTNPNPNNGTPLPQATVPIVTTNSSVSPSNATAVVGGTVNPKGALTNYWYEYGPTSSLGNKTASQSIGSGFVLIQAPGYISNLSKNTVYYFRLVAENQYGRVAGSQYSFKTTEDTPPPVGSAPTTKTVEASGISRTTANINGEVTPNKNTTQYWFEYGRTTNLGNTSAFSSAGDSANKSSVSISLSDLAPLTTYYFRLNAQNQFGTINGSILNFKTLGPSASTAPIVSSQSANAVSSSTATLHGTVNPSGLQTKYWFEYSTDSLLNSVSVSTTAKVTLAGNINVSSVKADISDLVAKTTYYFRLVAENSEGLVRSDKMNFKTK